MTKNQSPHPYIVITGASRGLGKKFAAAFASRKHGLVLAARTTRDLDVLADELRAREGIDVRAVPCDLSTSAGVKELCAACEGLPIGGVVNNAGFGLGGDFVDMPPERINAMLSLNIMALTQISHYFLPRLKSSRGFLINVASQAAFQPMPFMAAYAASKAYVLHLSEALYREVSPYHVHVMALCPGPTQTEFFNVAEINLEKTHLTLADSSAVVKEALQALSKRKVFVVTGWQNKLAVLAVRLISRKRVTQITQRLLGR